MSPKVFFNALQQTNQYKITKQYNKIKYLKCIYICTYIECYEFEIVLKKLPVMKVKKIKKLRENEFKSSKICKTSSSIFKQHCEQNRLFLSAVEPK